MTPPGEIDPVVAGAIDAVAVNVLARRPPSAIVRFGARAKYSAPGSEIFGTWSGTLGILRGYEIAIANDDGARGCIRHIEALPGPHRHCESAYQVFIQLRSDARSRGHIYGRSRLHRSERSGADILQHRDGTSGCICV